MTPTQSKALALVAVSAIEAKSAIEERKRDDMRQSMLDDAETEALISEWARARGTRHFTEAEAAALLNEVISIRIMHTCADLAMKGLINVDIDMTKPENDRLVFTPRLDIHDDLRDALRRREGGK